jgi:hypothetical protein
MRVQTHTLIPWLTFTAVRATPSELVDWRREESGCLFVYSTTVDGLSHLLLPGGAASCTTINHHPSEAESCNTLLRASLIFYI